MNNTVRHEHAGHVHEHTGHEHTGHEHADHKHTGHEHADHKHAHAVAEAAPASNDNLLLDIGGDTGALIIHAGADRDQAEIEISPTGNGGTHDIARTHNIVRRRQAAGSARYAAVFPAVPEGDYVIWRDADTPAGTVTVRGGTVASFRLSE